MTRAHDRDYAFELRTSQQLDGSPLPDPWPCCSYCGSIEIGTVLHAMVSGGTHFSGSDWKYGWPHKFYFEIACAPYQKVVSSSSGPKGTTYEVKETSVVSAKFYSDHVLDATEDQLVLWNRIVAPLLGVKFAVVDGNLRYAAVNKGFQTWGYVGNGALAAAAQAPIVPATFVESEFPRKESK